MALSITQGGLNWVSTMDASQLYAEIQRLQRGFNVLTTDINQVGVSIDNMAKKAAQAIATYISLTAATDLVKDIIRVRGEFQQLEVAFTTMLQSKQRADQLMSEAVKLAATTPFDLQQVATGAKQLLAYGFNADTVTQNIRMLGNVASGVGAPLNDIIYLYGTLQTQGRAYTRDIMQFTSRGIPIIAELAKQFGVSKEEVSKLVEAGKVGFPQIEKAFQSLTSEGGLFFNLMEEQSKTLTGQISNLQDAWVVMLNDIGKGQEGLAHDVLAAATAIVENYQTVIDVLGILIATYGSYKAALFAVTAIERIQATTMGAVSEGVTRSSLLYSREIALKVKSAQATASRTAAIAAEAAAQLEAEQANIAVLRAEVSLAAAKKAATAEAARAALAKIVEAKADVAAAQAALAKTNQYTTSAAKETLNKNLQTAQNKLLAASEDGVAKRKAASAAAAEFSASATALETAAKRAGTLSNEANAAAAVANAAAVNASAIANTRLTIIEGLRLASVRALEVATSVLNKTLYANPALTVTAAVGALVSAYFLLRDRTDQARSATELLADAQKKQGDSLIEQEAKIRSYVEVVKAGSLSEQQRLDIYNKLKEIDPKIVEGIDAKTLSYKQLASNVELYLQSLRERLALEANQEAITESLKQELKFRKGVTELMKDETRLKAEIAKIQASKNYYGDPAQYAAESEQLTLVQASLKQYRDNLAAQEAATRELSSSMKDQNEVKKTDEVQRKRTVAVIDEEIKNLQDEQKAVSSTSAEWKNFQKQIEALQKEREAITGATQKQLKAEETLENKVNAMLEKRRSLLEKIAGLQRDAYQSGLLKEQSAVDKIRETFQLVSQEIENANKEITKFNEKNQGKKGFTTVPLIGGDVTKALSTAEQAMITNTLLKEDAQKYIESLELKKKAYEEFQKIQLQGNELLTEKARELYKEQIRDYNSYVEYLKAEQIKLATIMAFGGRDIGIITAFTEIGKKLAEEEKNRLNRLTEVNYNTFTELLNATRNYESDKNVIANKYDKLWHSLEISKTLFTKEEYDKRSRDLKSGEEQEYADLSNSYARKSQLYRTLSQDIINMSREELKQRLADMEKWLKDGQVIDKKTGEITILTPQKKADLAQGIEQAKQFLRDTNELFGISAKRIKQVGDFASSISSSFLSLSSALELVNSDLAATLQTMGQIVGVAGEAAKAIGSFTAGDIAGGIASTVSAISGVISIFSSAKASEAQAKAEIEAFNQQILKGEIDINIAYRERQRLQAEINALKLQGLKDEQELLDKQKKENYDDYNRILAMLQQQQYVAGQTEEKYGGFLGINKKTRAVDVLASLSGMTYDQIEKLYMSGQLTDKAKALFEQLQKLNQEGADIDQQLIDLQKQAQEIYTGTTSDSILDGIIDGFKNGLRGAADFADSFQELMQNAVLNALKYQTLQPAIEDFYKQFADASQSGDVLTQDEIAKLQAFYNNLIADANKQFENLQSITGVNLSSSTASGSSLSGAIKGMTEQQAEVLAGNLGGLRVTAIQALNIANQQLNSLNLIVDNTSRLAAIEKYLRDQNLYGIKIKP